MFILVFTRDGVHTIIFEKSLNKVFKNAYVMDNKFLTKFWKDTCNLDESDKVKYSIPKDKI